LHLSRERIRQIEKGALNRLRQPHRARQLTSHLDGSVGELLEAAATLKAGRCSLPRRTKASDRFGPVRATARAAAEGRSGRTSLRP
jgi:hypothetical protein